MNLQSGKVAGPTCATLFLESEDVTSVWSDEFLSWHIDYGILCSIADKTLLGDNGLDKPSTETAPWVQTKAPCLAEDEAQQVSRQLQNW